MDSISGTPRKAMYHMLFVYGTMPARAWVMVLVEHRNVKSVETALVPGTTHTALRLLLPFDCLLARGWANIHGSPT